MTGFWNAIVTLQDQFFPNWRTKLPLTLYAAALAGEVGEVCGVVIHLAGGGTNAKKYTREQILHQCADVYVQLVLLLEKSGYDESDFLQELAKVVFHELPERLKLCDQTRRSKQQ